jgi:hypothetical protein
LQDTPAGVEGSNTYVNVEYGGKEYRTYLNGDTFLVAYEFTVSGEGVYVIGSVHGGDTTNNTKDSPMEIVHFSVSGTASAGRDGVQGSQLGAIDFVYDNLTDAIITVRTTSTATTLPNVYGNEDYNNYYTSHSMLYTDFEQKVDSSFILINDAKISIRRWLEETISEGVTTYDSVITYWTESTVAAQAEAIVVTGYTISSDTIRKLTSKP